MIKLKSIILETFKQTDRYPVIVGVITNDGEIQSKKSTSHHENLNLFKGKTWRYNPKTEIVYWWFNINNVTDLDKELVEDYLNRKYGYFIDKHISLNSIDTINSGDATKHFKDSHGHINEIYPSDARFGLGNVDSNGVVNFKEYSRDIFGSQIHGKDGTPYGRNTFRYVDGIVDWSDGHPEKEIKDTVETYLERGGYPFKKHISYYDKLGQSDDNIDEIYYDKLSDDEKMANAELYFSIGQEDDETTSKSYCWIWSKGDGVLSVKKDGTHSINFGIDAKDYTYSGWYDPSKKAISVVFPPHELRKLGNRKPTVDDIPTIVYNKLQSQFGKDNRFVVFEIIKKSQLKKLIKEILSVVLENKLRGEWWFQDGQSVFADGDVGDVNHEGMVLDSLRRQVLDSLGVDSSKYDFTPEISDLKNEIFENIGDELTPEELESWNNDDINEVIISYLTRNGDKNIKDIIYYIRGHDDKGKTLDIREYALVHWGWQRVKGNVVQTQTLTQRDLKNITNGLYDAYGDELENTNDENQEHTFNIEVMSTRSFYQGIPWSVLAKDDPTSLNAYRTRYE